MRTFIAFFLFAAIATCQGMTIKLPVLTSPIAGVFAPSSSWGNCDSEQKAYGGIADSNKECSMEKLKSVCKFEDDQAEMLFRLANSIIARHPMAKGEPIGADKDAKKCMCKVASECECQITQDWCKDE